MNIPEPLTVLIVTILVPLIAQGVKLLAATFKVDIKREWLTAFAFGLSLLLAWVWLGLKVPEYTDPKQFLTELATIATALFGTATLIYNLLLTKLFAMLGWTKDRTLTKARSK